MVGADDRDRWLALASWLWDNGRGSRQARVRQVRFGVPPENNGDRTLDGALASGNTNWSAPELADTYRSAIKQI